MDTKKKQEKFVDSELKKGLTRLVILIYIRKRGEYPYKILKDFSKSKHMFMSWVTKNDIYNAVEALKRKKLIKAINVRSRRGHRLQKKYVLTDKGIGVLNEAKRIKKEFILELRHFLDGVFE